MQAAHFHFRCRNAPLGMLKIKLSPFGLAKLARSDKDQWCKLQGCFGQPQSVVIFDGSEQGADISWLNDGGPVDAFGVVNAPRKSSDGSRSALPVAMAYRNTMPHVLRSRRAVSYRPRASTLRRTASNSGAVILAIGRSPITGWAKSSNQRCFARVTSVAGLEGRA